MFLLSCVQTLLSSVLSGDTCAEYRCDAAIVLCCVLCGGFWSAIPPLCGYNCTLLSFMWGFIQPYNWIQFYFIGCYVGGLVCNSTTVWILLYFVTCYVVGLPANPPLCGCNCTLLSDMWGV